MKMQNLTIAASLSALIAGMAVSAADAQTRGHRVSVQGPNGRGFTQSTQVVRGANSVSATRSAQNNAGMGVESSRNATWDDGAYNGSASRTFNNGMTSSRQTSVTDNGDGTVTVNGSHTGVNGQTGTVSGTFTRPPQ